MKHSATQRSQRHDAVSLFERAGEMAKLDAVRERIVQFARAVARRHRSERGTRQERGDVAKMLVALRGYYETWSLCAPYRVPPLNDELLAAASAAYFAACARRHQSTAA